MKYRSKLEERFHKLHPELRYEPEAISYVSKHKYTPDFIDNETGMYYETKGRFRDSREAAKYIAVRKSNPGIPIIFVFSDATLPMPNAQRRKDGTKRTHGEWAEKNGFEYFECRNPNKKRRKHK